MIVLTMLLERFLIWVPRCKKAASMNKRSPVENPTFSVEAYTSGTDQRFEERKKERKTRTAYAPD